MSSARGKKRTVPPAGAGTGLVAEPAAPPQTAEAAAAAAAAPPAKKGVQDEDAYIKMIDEQALGDAFHDFKGTRGTKSVKDRLKDIFNKLLGTDTLTFQNIYDTHNGIGIYKDSAVNTHRSEHETLTHVTGGEVTRTKMLTPSANGENSGEFTVPNTDYQYSWHSILFSESQKEDDTDIKDVTYKVEPVKFFDDFLTEGQAFSDLFVFTIDAVNVKFYDLFLTAANTAKGAANTAKGANKIRKIWYVKNREGTQDSAGKPDLTGLIGKTKGKLVELEGVDDTYPSDIKYPPIEKGTLNDPHVLFDSIFAIQVQNEKAGRDGIASTTTTFHTKEFTTSVQVNKGRKEEHPNSVNSLFPKLAESLAAFRRGQKTKAVKDKYYVTLQQKRTGDWLQVLASLDPSRYPALPAGAEIVPFSEDWNFISYCITVGGDCALTLYDPPPKDSGLPGKKWIVMFRRLKNPELIKKSKEKRMEALTAEIQADPLHLIKVHSSRDNQDLEVACKAYITQRDAVATSVKGALTKAITDLEAAFNAERRAAQWKTDEAVLNPLRDVLKAALNLASLYSMIIPLPASIGTLGLEAAIKKYEAIHTGTDSITTDKEFKQATDIRLGLQKVVGILNSVLPSNRKKGVASFNDIFKFSMDKIHAEKGAKHESEKGREKLINSLRLFDKLFQPANAATNAVGLFQFFQTSLDDTTKRALRDGINTAMTSLIDKLPAQADKNSVASFNRVVQTLLEDNKVTKDDEAEEDIVAVIHDIDTGKVAGASDELEGDQENALENEQNAGGRRRLQSGGADPETRQFFECTAFTPGLRILAAMKYAELESLQDAFYNAQIAEEAVGGLWDRLVGGIRALLPWGGGDPPKSFRDKFDLHPLTYLFFYVRDTLFQLETLRPLNATTRLRFAQLFIAWIKSYKAVMKDSNPRKNPFAARVYYSVLTRFLLGHAPRATEPHQVSTARAFYKILDLPLSEIANYTRGINEGYFGKAHLENYYRIPFEDKKTIRILNDVLGRFKKMKPLPYSTHAAESATMFLDTIYNDIPEQLTKYLAAEQTILQQIANPMPAITYIEKAGPASKRQTVKAGPTSKRGAASTMKPGITLQNIQNAISAVTRQTVKAGPTSKRQTVKAGPTSKRGAAVTMKTGMNLKTLPKIWGANKIGRHTVRSHKVGTAGAAPAAGGGGRHRMHRRITRRKQRA